jgi:hypothetical protein
MKHKFTKKKTEGSTDYPVVGAGFIRMGDNAGVICGGRAGIDIGVSWGQFGPDSGGVLSREHARALADRIYEILDSCEESEEKFYNDNMSHAKWDPTNV